MGQQALWQVKRNIKMKRNWNPIYWIFGSIKLGFESFERVLEQVLAEEKNES